MNISLCHCPSSAKLPNIFENTGHVPYDEWSDVVTERVGWILGGDLNLNENYITTAVKKYQPPTPQADLSTSTMATKHSSTMATLLWYNTCKLIKGPRRLEKTLGANLTPTTWSLWWRNGLLLLQRPQAVAHQLPASAS